MDALSEVRAHVDRLNRWADRCLAVDRKVEESAALGDGWLPGIISSLCLARLRCLVEMGDLVGAAVHIAGEATYLGHAAPGGELDRLVGLTPDGMTLEVETHRSTFHVSRLAHLSFALQGEGTRLPDRVEAWIGDVRRAHRRVEPGCRA